MSYDGAKVPSCFSTPLNAIRSQAVQRGSAPTPLWGHSGLMADVVPAVPVYNYDHQHFQRNKVQGWLAAEPGTAAYS